MNQGKLSRPSREVADRILTEVGFADRLIGYRLHPRMGSMAISLLRAR